MAQQRQIRQIRIEVDTKGNREIEKIANQLGQLSKNTKSIAGNFNLLRNAFLGYTAALRVGDLAALSDEMQQLFDRITILSGGTDQASKTMYGLLNAANETKTSIDGLATIYARLAASTKATGVSQESLLALTKVLQNSFRLSGATIAESTAATIQLSQGFASGQLRGQELRSVLEQNVVIGDILTKTFGKTRGEIYKMAEAGQLTADKVMKALFDNMDQVNGKAAKLGQTFEQTVTVAMNNFKIKILEINREFDLSGKFAQGLNFVTEKIGLIGAGIVLLATTQIPALITSCLALNKAFLTLLASNPFTALIALDVFLAVTFVRDLDELGTAFKRLGAVILAFASDITRALGQAEEAFGSLAFIGRLVGKLSGTFKAGADALNKSADIQENIRYNRELEKARAEAAEREKTEQKIKEDMIKLSKMQNGEVKKTKDILGDLNKEYLNGAISAEKYFVRLKEFENMKFTREFKEGKFDLEKYNLKLNEIARDELFDKFRKGQLGFEKFNAAIAQNRIEDLNIKLEAGTINLQEYNAEFIKLSNKLNYGGAFQTGLAAYIDSVGTASTMLADAVKNTFSTLEDEIFQATKNGEFNFARLTQSILDDLQRILIRALIVRPLVEGILGYISPGKTSGNSAGESYNFGGGTMQAAKGASFDKGVRKFAAGGLVTKPTLFGYGGGRTGLMGEAGTEAILPLRRGSNGDLGVQTSGGSAPVIVNIINNSGAEVEQTESQGPNGERIIQVMIQKEVRNGLSSGAFDKSLMQNFNLKRKGS